MRTKLRKLYGIRTRFVGTFEKTGTKTSYRMRQVINEFGKPEWVDYEKTILLLNIKNEKIGEILL